MDKDFQLEENFKQEYLYIEKHELPEVRPKSEPETDEESDRGFIVIDIF